MSLSSSERSTTPKTRVPHHSRVLFATFCEPANFGIPEIQALARSHPELFVNDVPIPMGFRIVVSRRGMRCFFTLVPLSYGPNGTSKGDHNWPPEGRKVDVLGVLTNLLQDDWEAYKIDPQYYCFFPNDGSIPSVRKRDEDLMASSDAEQSNPPFEPITPQNRPFTKRTGSGIVDSEDASPKKRPKTTVESAEDTESDLDERIHGYEATKAKLKRQDGRGRKKKTSSFSRMGDMADDLPELFTFSDARSPSPVPTATRKEKVAMETDPTQTKRPLHNGEPDQHFEQGSKRPRLASPGYSDIDEKVRRAARLRRENTSYRQRTYQRPTRSKQRESDFWQDVNFEQFRGQSFAVDPDAAQDSAHPSEPPTQEVKQEEEPPLASSRNPIIIEDDSDDDDDVQRTPFDRRDPNWRPNAPNKHQTDESSRWDYDLPDSDEERLARLEESRRKLGELNSHDTARKEAKRRADEERRRDMEEMRRRRQREEQAEESRRRREQAKADQERRRKEEERRQREQPRFGFNWFGSEFENDPYSTHTRGSGRVNFEWFENIPRNYRANGRASTSTNLNRWTPALALERYNRLSESFDNFKGTPENPVPPLDQVPWPVLFQPPFQLEQVDWASVEKFFENAETLMSGRGVGKKQWKEFLKTSTRRFHPDRWRARGLIGGKGWGSDVEEKVNHVSKVLTPLYRALG